MANGILDQAGNTTVSGFTVEHAQLEGILVEPPPSSWPTSATASPANVYGVTIENNLVEHTDLAYDTTAANPFAACRSSPTDGDDCGEGIHLLATSHSRVIGNRVANNVGGILVSDGGLNPTSVGPAAHNVIEFNTSTDNLFDCGITLPSHEPRAVAMTGPNAGQPQPRLAGVYTTTWSRTTSRRATAEPACSTRRHTLGPASTTTRSSRTSSRATAKAASSCTATLRSRT